ncbi:serine hydrolase [Cryobacterium sp. SO2]|uniref:serine hydrolase domain-containing protein n=1 Tax=Cryobacterium sp. SO2 TaxID=1897060 RepID=UPI00223D2567|nr:serine hydrolase domain-containing protein [Cryobacterium sp. SO2]WEO77862.1 serine hydrolase [Cryobacterium sp. SO2]
MTASTDQRLTILAERLAARTHTPTLWRLERPDAGWSWSHGDQAQPFFLASITKLYVTALILQLCDEGLLTLDSPAAGYLPAGTLTGLNTVGGTDNGGSITVRMLLAQTSGLADYFEGPGGMLGTLLQHDLGWSDADALDRGRGMPARFAPGSTRAHYSDTNFQLLGMIIEAVTGATFEEAVTDRILDRAALGETWPFTAAALGRYDDILPIRSGTTDLRIPLAMASVRAQGGLVSSAPDAIRFLRAFVAGAFFDVRHLSDLTASPHRVFGPISYGLGVMRFQIPRLLSPFAPIPVLVGHSGSTGTVLYHSPQHDLFITGAVNKLDSATVMHQYLARMAAAAAWGGR